MVGVVNHELIEKDRCKKVQGSTRPNRLTLLQLFFSNEVAAAEREREGGGGEGDPYFPLFPPVAPFSSFSAVAACQKRP